MIYINVLINNNLYTQKQIFVTNTFPWLNHVKINKGRDSFLHIMSYSFLRLYRQLKRPMREQKAFHMTYVPPFQDYSP